MSVAIICCQSLEQEIKKIIRDIPEVTHLEVMDWTLHNDPPLLLKTVAKKIEEIQDDVDAIMLGYGRCQILDQLPDNYKVPVFRPDAQDCIGVLLGQKRYEKEREQQPGTWYLTRGWTEICMKIVSNEIENSPFVEEGQQPVDMMRGMLKYYDRGLFIETDVGNKTDLQEKAERVTEEFDLRLEKTCGSVQLLEDTLREALDA